MTRARWPHLILAGYGASDPLQMTIEAQHVAVSIGRMLGLAIPGRLRVLLERQGVEVTDLIELYQNRPYAEAYAAVAHAVLWRAENDPPAMFVSQGNPLLLNAVNRYLLVEARQRDLTVRVYPGVSPIDAVVSELGVDVGTAGIQTISARGLVARPTALNPRMPLLLLQVAGLADGLGSAEVYGRLVTVLRDAYPDTQPVTLLNSPGDGRITRATVTLARFGKLVPHMDASSSLFIDIATGPSASTGD